MIDLPAVATRVDRAGGYREEITFMPVRDTRLFSVSHLPLTMARAGLVICPPILMEHLTNYRHEVLLARALASRGIAVQRFHYRGTGHSEGDERETSMETMVEDATAAVERLRQAVGDAPLAFHGTRWGTRVAGAVAVAHAGAVVMFWEPVVDAARYFRELIRGRLVRQMKDTRFADSSADAWRDEMAREGRVDILGYPLYRTLYESARGPGLDEAMAAAGRRDALIVQLGGRGALRPDVARLKQALEGAGGTCDVRIIRDEPAWMFAGHRMKSVDRLVATTANWLTARTGDARG